MFFRHAASDEPILFGVRISLGILGIGMPGIELCPVRLGAGRAHARKPMRGLRVAVAHLVSARALRIAIIACAICHSTPFTLIPFAVAISS